jgi:hypothetical protein
VYTIVEGAKVLLSHRGSHEVSTHLQTIKILLKDILRKLSSIVLTDADKRVDSITELDEISKACMTS